MDLSLQPLIVTCDSCGKTAETFNGDDPDSALECDCCPFLHNHAGLGCRTVTITAFARLTIFDINDLMEAISDHSLLPGEPVPGNQGEPVQVRAGHEDR